MSRIVAEAFTTQSWVDWDPGSDRNGNCVGTNVSITILGFGISLPTEKCELWDMTKYTAVKYDLKWVGKINSVDRQLDFELGVRVSQNAWPQWFVPASVYSDPYP